MPLQPIKDVREYKRLKESLKSRFESEKTGEQSQIEDQTKLFQPLISTQQATAKSLQSKLEENQMATEDVLIPLTRAIQQRNAQQDVLALYPPDQPPHAVQALAMPLQGAQALSPFHQFADLDKPLSSEDEVNLMAMGIPLPSVIFGKNLFDVTKEQIVHFNKSHGQFLRKNSNIQPSERLDYESRKRTLAKLKSIVTTMEEGKQFISSKSRRSLSYSGSGIQGMQPRDNVIYYSAPEDLCTRLALLYAAKKSGNNGVDNDINSILDELLRINTINKDEYAVLYRKIF